MISGEIVLWSGNKCGQPCDEVFRCKHKVRGAIPERVQTLSTIGYGAMTPQSTYADVIVTIEAGIGLLGVAEMAKVFSA